MTMYKLQRHRRCRLLCILFMIFLPFFAVDLSFFSIGYDSFLRNLIEDCR